MVVARGRIGERAGSKVPGVPLWDLAPVIRFGPRAVTAALMTAAVGHRASVVHVHFGHRVRDVLGLCRRTHLPLVISLHGHDVTAFARAHPAHYAGVWERADAVLVPSRFLADVALGLGAPAPRVEVVPAGVDLSRWSPSPRPDGPPTVLFVGRLVDKKGVDVLMSAWPSVRRRVPQARLRVLGEGPLACLVSGEGVERLLPDPSRPRDQVSDAMAAATVVVTPSRTAQDGDAESLLLVNLEAQASGRPVVTTRHGGITEFVDEGRTALVVPEGQPGPLADALVRVLGEPALAARLGEAGPAWARQFDGRAATARIDALYDELAARRR